MNIRFTIAYEGTHYRGWQLQKNTEDTIQGRLTQLFSRYYKIDAKIKGASRTDAGVHALGQVFNVTLPVHDEETLQRDLIELNNYLPKDIRLLEAQIAEARFHSRLNAEWKHYRYTLAEGTTHPLYRRFETSLDRPRELDRIKAALPHLIGTHDYKALSDHTNKKSSVRTIHDIQLHVQDRPGGRQITIDFAGDGFLYHMIRYIVGTLVQIGQGQQVPDIILERLEAKEKSRATYLAPAEGLILMDVHYTPWGQDSVLHHD